MFDVAPNYPVYYSLDMAYKVHVYLVNGCQAQNDYTAANTNMHAIEKLQ
jgi:hypothetical protein